MSHWERVLEATTHARAAELFAYAHTLTGDDAIAAAVVEDALAAVFGRRAYPRTVDEAWTLLQHAMRRAAVRAHPTPSAPTSEAADEDDDLPADLRTLPVRERALLAMRYVDGLAVPAIAHETGLATHAVEDALTRAVESLSDTHPELRLSVRDALEGGTLAQDVVVIGAA
ncbi:RNA polymerase sigma factor [Demequina mangrovi]|uniref:DNA-directed RNA polymerase specialized sigma subunit, sigma24 family n=1 Tax=Demequina mangrovi TaxID=1043493 RepID=A0A1H6XGB0_9MICO|nr:sigma factor-like helix-turn-helix DNA-binding protein [Demequina mangrovi]SEJ26574.1 DNA-directed RNA polymerase specialized sigma subunit, sigma24 family [Demequina mangrovi]